MHKLVWSSIGALVFLAACKHPGSQKLEGRWRGQQVEGVPEAMLPYANTFAVGSEIIAQGNQIVIHTPGGKNAPATYVVDKEDATTVVIHTDRDGTRETFVLNDKADTLVWKVDQQRSITFKKVR